MALVVEGREGMLGFWVDLGDGLGVIWMELKALDCSGKEEEEELVSGRGRGGECRWLSCSQDALSLKVTKGVEGGVFWVKDWVRKWMVFAG